MFAIFFAENNIKSTCVPVKCQTMAKEFHGYDYFHYHRIEMMRFYLGMLTEDVLHMFSFSNVNFAFIRKLSHLVSP